MSRDAQHIPWAFSLAGAARLPLTGESHPLRREAWRWLLWANAAAVLLGAAGFGVWLYMTTREKAAPAAREVRLVRYTELGVPPSIARPAAPQVSIAEQIAEAVAPPSIGVPEPVPDEQAQTQTIATIEEMTEALAPITASDLGGSGTGDSLVVDVDVQEREPAPEEFVPVDEDPVRLSMDPPVFPPMALQAGIEGTVTVHALVGKDGKVKRCIVLDGPGPLHEAAVTAAMTAVFKPAIMENRPVEVWVAMPITFRLQG